MIMILYSMIYDIILNDMIFTLNDMILYSSYPVACLRAETKAVCLDPK